MKIRRFAAVMVVAALAMLAAQPVMAGVGGCKKACISANPTVSVQRSMNVLEILGDVVSPRLVGFLKAVFNPTPKEAPITPLDPFTGLPCRKGVGGC